MNRFARVCFASLVVAAEILSVGPARAQVAAYDPLAVTRPDDAETLDLVVRDAARDRAVPILVYLPAERTPAPVVLFSHGLGGSRHGSAYLGQHWAARGYLSVFVQHPGSDASVWEDEPARDRLEAMRAAASRENLQLRLGDIPAVLDQLERWGASGNHELSGRMSLDRIGMSGHSFGAVTTQALSGQRAGLRNLSSTDSRIVAAIAFSPSSPRLGRPERAFGQVEIPWMLMTGTSDTAPIADIDAESRLAVFPALPSGGKYELVLDGAEHSAFTERSLPGDTAPRNPNHHRVILALSTAFWDTWLRDDAGAKAWLDGEGPRSVLEEGDRWRTK